MCNACGFLCCAYDGFSGCGCDHCPESACWTDEDEFYDDDEDDFDFGPVARPALMRCRPVTEVAEARALLSQQGEKTSG
ncbi:hypothetical protein [Phenylobacterium sp.]|uniref:hypothetical protein n=1 Tax=Phenylobacterium sp. TaxID=1871053 RepID=UPI003936D7B7